MARTFHHGSKAKERHFGADWRWQATPSWWIRAMMPTLDPHLGLQKSSNSAKLQL